MANYSDFEWVSGGSMAGSLSMIASSQSKAVEVEGCQLSDVQLLDQVADTTCQAIYFQNNHFGDAGTVRFSHALKTNVTLTYLYLGANRVGDAACEHLSRTFLENNTTLKYLYLGDNLIGEKGAACLALGLSVNASLVELNLWNNQIGAEGGCAIASALKENDCLNHFDIGRNKLGDAGVMAFAEALKVNTGLICSNISFNGFGDKAVVALVHGLDQNRTLTKITTNGNTFNTLIYTPRLRKLLKANASFQRQAFENALLDSDRQAKWMRSRLMLVGQERSGKTATVRSLLGKRFCGEWKSTVGVDLTQLKTKIVKREWEELAGDEAMSMNYELTTKLAAESAVTSILSARAQERQKPAVESTQLQKKMRLSNACEKIKSAVIAKFDQDLLIKARKERKALTMSIWDYAGQEVFYSLHHLFLTDYGFYVVLFSMEGMLNNRDKCLEGLRFWVNALSLHAPSAPIVIVGSFLDVLGSFSVDDRAARLRKINDVLSTHVEGIQRCRLKRNEAQELLFFPLNNVTMEGIGPIREVIESTTRRQTFVKSLVSLKWTKLLDTLMKEKRESWVSLSSVEREGTSLGITSSEEIQRMLELFHNMGLILHFSGNETLKNLVILDPQWLIDMICKVIRDPIVHSVAVADELTKDKQLLITQGLASRDILDYFWGTEHCKFMLEVMKMTLLLSEYPFENAETGTQRLVLIPSIISREKPLVHAELYNPKRLLIKVSFVRNEMPTGVFHRLLCMLVEHSTMRPVIYKNACVITFDGQAEVEMTEVKQDNCLVIALDREEVAQKLFRVLSAMLRKLNAEIMKNRLSWEFWLRAPNTNEFVPYQEARDATLSPWFGCAKEENLHTEVTMDTVLQRLGGFDDI